MKGVAIDEIVMLLVRGILWRAKPYERLKHEIRLQGVRRRKPLGGWESLKGERARWGKPGWSGLWMFMRWRG
jgi:hypothetical protein